MVLEKVIELLAEYKECDSSEIKATLPLMSWSWTAWTPWTC